MLILPQKLAEMKDSSSVFYVNLVILHFSTGDVYLAALDVDVQWFKPSTTTPATYLAVPLQLGTVTKYADDKVDNLELTISDVTKMFSSMLFNATDFRGTMVSVLQIAYPGSLTDGSQYKYLFYGYMDEPEFDESKATFKTTLCAVLPNMTCHRTLGLSCSAWFGDNDECGCGKTSMSGTCGENSSQNMIYSSSFTQQDNFWINGVITVDWEARKVVDNGNGWVKTEYPFYSTKMVGATFTIENGCDGSKADCIRHGNLQNYGGYLSIPTTELVIKT